MPKLRELVEGVHYLTKLFDLEVNAAAAFTLGRARREVDEYLKDYNAVLQAMHKKYGEKVDDNGPVTRIKPENTEVFTKELNALLDKDITFNSPKIKLKDLDGDGVKVSGMTLSTAHFLIEDTEGDATPDS